MAWAAAHVGGRLGCVWNGIPGCQVFRMDLGSHSAIVLGRVSGWVDSSGVQKMTLFANFFSSSVVTALMRVVGALLGTLNSRIPSLSEAAYDRSIYGLVSSLKM